MLVTKCPHLCKYVIITQQLANHSSWDLSMLLERWPASRGDPKGRTWGTKQCRQCLRTAFTQKKLRYKLWAHSAMQTKVKQVKEAPEAYFWAKGEYQEV